MHVRSMARKEHDTDRLKFIVGGVCKAPPNNVEQVVGMCVHLASQQRVRAPMLPCVGCAPVSEAPYDVLDKLDSDWR